MEKSEIVYRIDTLVKATKDDEKLNGVLTVALDIATSNMLKHFGNLVTKSEPNKPRTDAGTDPETKADAGTKPETKPETKTDAETKPKTKPKTKIETELEAKAESAGHIKTLPSIDLMKYAKDLPSVDKDILNPLHVLNTIPYLKRGSKTEVGTHPFFLGSASYLTYLELEKRSKYIANIFMTPEYAKPSDMFDLGDIKQMVTLGIDPHMLGCMVTKEKRSIFEIADAMSRQVNDQAFVDKIELKKAGLEKMLQKITPEYPWLFFRFMTARALNNDVIQDIVAISNAHSTAPKALVGYSNNALRIPVLVKLNMGCAQNPFGKVA